MATLNINGREVFIDDSDLHLIDGRTVYINNVQSKRYPEGRYEYVQVSGPIGKRTPYTLLHRLVMGVSEKSVVVDHKNHNTLDNRKQNLRVCSRAQNLQNKSGRRGRELPRGVYERSDRPGTFTVEICAFGRIYKKSGFKTISDAENYSKEMAEILHGDFAYHTSIDSNPT